jgi:hypothetical protein
MPVGTRQGKQEQQLLFLSTSSSSSQRFDAVALGIRCVSSFVCTPVAVKISMMKADTAAQSKAEAFAQSIMREPEPIDGSDGMSVFKDIVNLETGRMGPNVVVRNITVPFWQACIDLVDTPQLRYRVCAVGSSGIGKSSCTPVLIRMLLKRKATVVYLIRSYQKASFCYEFIPNANGSVTTRLYPEKEGICNIASLNSESTYYVVDPGHTQDSCNPASDFQAKVIIVASPDSRRWGDGEFRKARGTVMGFFKYFPVWELSELLAARMFFPLSIDEEEVVVQRYSEIGGFPPLIFLNSQSSFDRELRDQEINMNKLTLEQVTRIARHDDIFLDPTSQWQPRGNLLTYAKSRNDDYTFDVATVAFASPLVKQKIYTKFKKELGAEG